MALRDAAPLRSPSAADEGRPRVRPFFVSAYTLAYFGVWMALLTPPTVTLALRVASLDPANKAAHLSWILGLGAIVATFANPIAGLLSDRTTSRLGRRRPWLIGGMVVGLLGLYTIAVGNITLILIGWCVAQLGFNAVLAAIVAILPDQVPTQQRGSVSGMLGVCLQLGIVAGVYSAKLAHQSMLLMFMVPGVIAATLVALLAVVLKDRHNLQGTLAPLDLLGFLKSFRLDVHSSSDFLWAFASRFLLYMGLATLLTYQVFYLLDKLRVPADSIPDALVQSTFVTTVTMVLASVTSGWLSDRWHRRKIFVLSAALIYAAGLALIAIAATFHGFLIGIAICGTGQGVYFAVDLALVTEVLPNQESAAGKDLGIYNLANVLPQSVAPAIAPIFLSIGAAGLANNYSALFSAAAAFTVLGALAIIPIRAVR
jgi:MFS family permease